MLRVSLRNLLVNKLRLLLTVMAVVVGVSFVSGTFVLSDTMVKAFDELYAGLTSGTDVVVRAQNAYDADVTTTGGQLRPLDDEHRRHRARRPRGGGGRGLGHRVRAHHRQARRPHPAWRGAHVRHQHQRGPAAVGRGHDPGGPSPVWAATRSSSTRARRSKAGFRVGDSVDVVLQDGRQTFTLVGIVGFGETDSLLGATLAGFDLSTAQQVLGKPGLVDEVDVRAADGVERRASCATGSRTCCPTASRP